MKMTVLMENTSLDPALTAEHGLGVYIETEKHHILLDTGASGATVRNADRLGVDLSRVDTVVLSHGHYDHSGGMLAVMDRCPGAQIYMQAPALEAYYHGERYIGIDPMIAKVPNLHLLQGDHAMDDELSLFAGITGRRFWPKSNLALSKRVGKEFVQDVFDHEQCLVIDGKILLSGCAHNGILNILDRFRELYGHDPEIVVSGFHMMKKTEYDREEADIICETAKELAGLPTVFYTGHCTGQKAFDLMQPIMGEKLQPIHAGTVICRVSEPGA